MNPLDRQLIKACQNGDALTVEKFLQQGANPNAQDDNGRTPTIIAAEYGHIPIITILIQYGANPHIRDDWEKTALHHAVEKGQHNVAQYLMTQLQFDPNAKDGLEETPFLLAIKNNDIDMLQLLAQHGANPHATDDYGRTVLYYAVEKKYHDITQYLLTQLSLNPNSQSWSGENPFLRASKKGDIKMLQLLARHGANPHATDRYNRTALHYAVENENYDNAQCLITQFQLDPNSQDHEGITPLMIAAQKGDIKMLRLLIQYGANPHITDNELKNALHHAVENLRYEAAEYLLTQLQLDPNSQDQWGRTPFLLASRNGDIKMLQLLTQLGANPHATDRQGQNALHYAAKYNARQAVLHLITHHHLNPNAQDHGGNTPLQLTIQNGCVRTAKTLIQLGADPYIPNHQGQTPTAIARQCEHQLGRQQPSTITL